MISRSITGLNMKNSVGKDGRLNDNISLVLWFRNQPVYETSSLNLEYTSFETGNVFDWCKCATVMRWGVI